MNNTTIVWDWNGTIVDDSYIFVDIMNSYLQKFNLKTISIQDYRQHFRFPVKDYYTKLGLNFSDAEFNQLSVDFIEKYKKVMYNPLLKKNIHQILLFCKKKKYNQYIVSAQEQELLKKSIKFYGLSSFFYKTLGLNNNLAVSKIKLAKDAFKNFPQKTKMLVIGDTVHDYEVAAALNCSCCLVSWGHNSKERLKKTGAPVVANVEELFDFIKKY